MKKLTVFLCVLLVFLSLLSPVGLAAGAKDERLKELDFELADAYLYCQRDGMPKYWLDFTRSYADNPVLHCSFRSEGPGFYESLFILDLSTAEVSRDAVTIHTVSDRRGFDCSGRFKRFVLRVSGNRLVMDVERDEKTLAGGAENNILTGSYSMEPVGVKTLYEYRLDDGMRKYWLEADKGKLTLHAMFRSGEPSFHEELFTVDPDTVKAEGAYTLVVGKLFNEKGFDVSGWFKSLKLTQVQGAINMVVERDEKTLAGGADDNILSGVYMLEPHSYLAPGHEGPYTVKELARWAQIHYFTEKGYFPPRADVEKNDDGSYSIHLYELVSTAGYIHTATSAWYTVDAFGVGVDDIYGNAIRLAG